MGSLLLFCTCTALIASAASSSVLLVGDNETFAFECIDANFAPRARGTGKCGVLYLTEPPDACAPLLVPAQKHGHSPPYALIVRGGCSFEEKVRRAQRAGFSASIVYDDEDDGILVSMAGNPSGIKIYAVFVSKRSGGVLKRHIGVRNMKLCMVPDYENSMWSIMMTAFTALIVISSVLGTCFFLRRNRPGPSRSGEFHRMSSHSLKALPSFTFTSALGGNCTSFTCAICLEDYSAGERLRLLPCNHKFHAPCVDAWLTEWRTYCPVCKQDAKSETREPAATESTPLLTSAQSSPPSWSVPAAASAPPAFSSDCRHGGRSVFQSPATANEPHHDRHHHQTSSDSYRLTPPPSASR